jgi:hypothetical protein
MFALKFEKRGSNSVFVVHNGGETEEAVKAYTLKTEREFHNKYYSNKLEENDIKIVECVNVGDYEEVMKELERG